MLLFNQLNLQLHENNVMAKANKLGQRKDSSKIKDEELVITLIYRKRSIAWRKRSNELNPVKFNSWAFAYSKLAKNQMFLKNIPPFNRNKLTER